MLFAKIPSPSIPSSTLELDDKIFRGFKDSLSMEAINGRRDTEYILKIIEKSYVNFQYLLKFVKLWAKSTIFQNNFLTIFFLTKKKLFILLQLDFLMVKLTIQNFGLF